MKNTSYVAFGILVLSMVATPGCDWLKRKEPAAEPRARIIDVNTIEIYNDARIPGAIHLELDELEDASKNWNKTTPVILYCSDYMCGQSHIGAKRLTKLGFENAAVYAGGINEWYRLSQDDSEKYPLEGNAELAFLKKVMEKVDSKEEDVKVVSAQEVALLLDEKKD